MSFADLMQLHFLRPWWLAALLALPLLWKALRAAGDDANAWRGTVDAHLLAHLLVAGDKSKPSRLPRRLALAAWTLATLALAGPAWERLPQPLYQNKAARVIAFELSQTMLAQDVKPSRFARARYKIADILKRSADAQTALIAYAGDAFVVAPLTDDANTVANLVDALDPTVMPAPGNATSRAIELGVKLLQQGGVREGEIVLLADGIDAGADAAVARASAVGVRVSVLGIGSTEGAPVALAQGGFLKDANGDIALARLDSAALAALAAKGGGRYAAFASDGSDLDALLVPLAARDAAEVAKTEVQSERFIDRGPWLLLALVPLVALGFRRGWLLVLPLVLFVHAPLARANVWDDLWRRADQQAQAELDTGHAKEAQALAHDPNLRGSAAYRAGDFAAAGTDFENAVSKGESSAHDADANYNRGNALAKQGKFEEAVAAYDRALKQSPGMGDAAANKKSVEDWLQQQKQQQQQQSQQDKDHQGHEQQQPGNDQGQDSQSKDGKGDQQGESGGDKRKSQQQDGKDQQGGSEQEGKQREGQDKSGQSNAGADKKSGERAQQPKAGSEASDQSQQQFKQGIDQALKQAQNDGKDGKPVRLGARESSQHSEKDQAVEQMLQRVPDDPGGLLRRKFQLEYQRRGHAVQEEGQ
jgi:Ca-activated chloride channel family protein